MSLRVYTSTVEDGSLKSIHDGPLTVSGHNRVKFLEKQYISPNDTTLVRLVYEGEDYTRYTSLSERGKGDGIVRPSTITADALVVTESGHALLLPLADCIGVVIHDTTQNILMVSHLGRHNLEQRGGTKSVEYLVDAHGSQPEDLAVWLSPAAGREQYPLYAFEDRSLHDVAVEQLIYGGVSWSNITVSPINSAQDITYFSHSQFLKGNRETDGRFAIVAVLS